MSAEKLSNWKKIKVFMKSKYRLVILNDTTFGEKLSLRLSPIGILMGMLAITILMTTLVISLVAFTSLREYIPGYGSISERKQILALTMKTDSIEQSLEEREMYINNVLHVLQDSLERRSEKPKKDTSGKYKNVDVDPGISDKQFREEYEQNKSSVASFTNPKLKGLSELVFFAPVKGLVISSYNIKEEHYGVDIVTKVDEKVKNVLDGTVVFTGFSAQDGYVIHIQHSNNITSIFKHNSELLKKTGDRLSAGDVVAVVGNTGDRSKGPHLHFELWYNGIPIDPQDCITF